jgi:hypothetical protein
LLEGIQALSVLSRQAAETESRAGPSWLHEQSLAAIGILSELEAAARNGRLQIGPGFSFRDRLGASWVDLHGDIRKVCTSLDELIRSQRLDV